MSATVDIMKFFFYLLMKRHIIEHFRNESPISCFNQWELRTQTWGLKVKWVLLKGMKEYGYEGYVRKEYGSVHLSKPGLELGSVCEGQMPCL